MCSAGTCCHRLAGGSDLARVRQRRRALLVWSDVTLAPLTFTSRFSGCYCSRRRRARAAECRLWQHDRLRASWACIPLPCSQSACCNSRPALTFTLGVRFFQPVIAHRLRGASVPRVGLVVAESIGAARPPGEPLRGGLGASAADRRRSTIASVTGKGRP